MEVGSRSIFISRCSLAIQQRGPDRNAANTLAYIPYILLKGIEHKCTLLVGLATIYSIFFLHSYLVPSLVPGAHKQCLWAFWHLLKNIFHLSVGLIFFDKWRDFLLSFLGAVCATDNVKDRQQNHGDVSVGALLKNHQNCLSCRQQHKVVIGIHNFLRLRKFVKEEGPLKLVF